MFILIVMLLLAGLTVYRYRRQIRSFLHFWKSVKELRNELHRGRPSAAKVPASVGPLVHCAKCGDWVPEESSVRLGPTSFFCSTDCLEASVKVP